MGRRKRVELPSPASPKRSRRSNSNSTKRAKSLRTRRTESIVANANEETRAPDGKVHLFSSETVLDEHDDLAPFLKETKPSKVNDDLPMRILDRFSFHDFQSQRLAVIPVDYDIEEYSDIYGGSGTASTINIEDDSSGSDSDSFSDDNKVLVRLGPIKEFWFGADLSIEDTDACELELWVRTGFAWYKLQNPSKAYANLFERMVAECVQKLGPFGSTFALDELIDPVVTPVVCHVAKNVADGLFGSSELITSPTLNSKHEIAFPTDTDEPIPFVVHAGNPKDIEWGHQIPGTNCYGSVHLDGEEYFVGDTIAVAPPGIENTRRRLNDNWFCEIRYFFDRATTKYGRQIITKMFHGRWLEHGSRTVLSEASNTHELFMMETCDDNAVTAIVQKIQVHLIESDGDYGEAQVQFDGELADVETPKFTLRYKWLPDLMTFSTFDPDEEECILNDWISLIGKQPIHKSCYACATKDVTSSRRGCNKLTQGVLSIYGIDYHVGDFVYVYTRGPNLAVAQICDLLQANADDRLKVQMLDKVQANQTYCDRADFRSIQITNSTRIINAYDLDGKCRVRSKGMFRKKDGSDLREWLEDFNNFILHEHSTAPQKQCATCDKENEGLEAIIRAKKSKKLRVMDLFAGAGGLMTGMDASGFMKTRWAIEHDPSAALTLEQNHQQLVVFNQNADILLRHAVDKDSKPLYAIGNRFEQLPPLPLPGEVDMIMGGPPCQPYSGANRFKRVDDIRQNCIPTMLSYVEYFSPRYVLLENVSGIVYHRIQGEQDGDQIRGGISGGMVKFILRTLTALGYQCQMRLLNAADYGAPQKRSRVIFWAAKIGLKLPQWPLPTHIPRGRFTIGARNIAGVDKPIPIASRNSFEEEGETGRRAPFLATTVEDAISDLIPWDWENPANIKPDVDTRRTGVETFVAHTSSGVDLAGYDYLISYACKPRCDYQVNVRSSHKVSQHYTGLFSSTAVERTVNVPMRPLASMNNLPRALRMYSSKDEELPERGHYTRLDRKGQFLTIRTRHTPDALASRILHPWDKRAISVREVARAQGFPDTYEFKSVSKVVRQRIEDEYKQLGNAVPCHLSFALGKAFGEGLARASLREQPQRAVA